MKLRGRPARKTRLCIALASLVSVCGLLLAVVASADGLGNSSSSFGPFPQQLEDWGTPAQYNDVRRWWDQANKPP